MQENDDKEKKKEPIEMTTDEAIDYCFGPEIADALRHEAHGDDDPDPED